jgi:P4 family phage/plasmid primase-like protien
LKLSRARIKTESGTEIKCLLETRGEGGYAITAPSNGKVHPSGKGYILLKGGFDQVATITVREREELHRLARCLDEIYQEELEKGTQEPINFNQKKYESTNTQEKSKSETGDDLKPGDDFNIRASWQDVLRPHGWQMLHGRVLENGGRIDYWRRPGKSEGVSAFTGNGENGKLFVFSSSTIFEQNQGISKFSAYAILNHDKNFSEAASDLAKKGFGSAPKTNFKPYFGKAPVNPETGAVLDHDAPIDEGSISDRALTDYGNAERLVDRFGDNIRFCHEQDWLIWTGKRWTEDKTGQLMRYAKETVRHIYGEAERAEDKDARKKIASHALTSEKRERLRAMIDLARDEAGIPTRATLLDNDPMTFNVLNGTVDLKTGQLQPHNRADLITKITQVEFKPGASCPIWLDFLGRIFNQDKSMIAFIQQAIGYSLTGLTVEQIFFLLYGTGSNGKSTFLEIIKMLLGDYAKATNFTTFLEKQGDSIRNDLAGLAGARFVVAKEAKMGKGFDESVIKELTGGDTISARFLRKEFFEFKPAFKIWLAANHKPRIKEQSTGIWRRVRLVPFETQIAEEEADRDLIYKLEAELPGILNWAIEGCLGWQKAGRLIAPGRVKEATEAYKSESDRLREFITENCFTGKATKHSVIFSILYSAYVTWCKSNDEMPLGKMSFRAALEERGFPARNGTANQVTVYGIALEEGQN